MTNILLLPDGCVAGIKSRALYCGKMHALKGALASLSCDKTTPSANFRINVGECN